MNRKGKKSPPTKAKKTKASRNRKSASSKSRDLFKLKSTSISVDQKKVKSNKRKASLGAIAEKSPKLKDNLAAKRTMRARSNNSPKTKLSLFWIAVYAVTITVGLSTILGTTISIASSFQTPAPEPKTTVADTKLDSSNQAQLNRLLTISSLGQEINPLKAKLENLAQNYPDLEPEVFLVDLDTNGFVSIRGQNEIASASTIKLPILVAFFQDLDRGKIKLEERLTMTEEAIAGGSGDMQYQEPGTKFSALETATKMITISDNTATNMLIERLGGMDALNQRFMTMGLIKTKLNNLLPDLTGTNTTTAEDLGNLLIKIDRGELLSLRSRDRLLHIMGNVVKDTLLPQGLEPGALIAHKTGDIKSVLADVGTIDMPNGKRYIASMLVKRPDNSPEAQEFIQKASGITYQYFKNPQTTSFTLEETKNEE